jgi:hypothetical protein
MIKVIGVLVHKNKEIEFDYTIDTTDNCIAIRTVQAEFKKKYGQKWYVKTYVMRSVKNGEANLKAIETNINRV